jgi:transcriptional regulator with XRE-family HTH domain
MRTLGDIIKEYRSEHLVSMDVFADKSGLSKSYISMLERNKDGRGNPIAPSIETIEKVAKGMNRSITDVIASLDPDQRITINTKPIQNSLELSDEELRIILRYRQMTEAEKNLVCNMMQVKRDEEFPSTRIEKLG